MAAYAQIVLTLALTTICLAIEYKPVFFPGPCPNVQPSVNFDEKSILDKFYGTYYTNPSFHGYHCLTNNITKTSNGIQFNAKFYNQSGQEFTFTNDLKSTKTPGLYDVSFPLHHDENVTVYGKEVFYSVENHVLVWGCVEVKERNQHTECTFVFSKLPTTPSASMDTFKKYLKQNGAFVGTYHEIRNQGCKN